MDEIFFEKALLVIFRCFAFTLKHAHTLSHSSHKDIQTHSNAQTCKHLWQSFADVTGTIRRLNTQHYIAAQCSFLCFLSS